MIWVNPRLCHVLAPLEGHVANLGESSSPTSSRSPVKRGAKRGRSGLALSEEESAHPLIPRTARVPHANHPRFVVAPPIGQWVTGCQAEVGRKDVAPPLEKESSPAVEPTQLIVKASVEKTGCIRFSNGRMKKMVSRCPKWGYEGDDSAVGSDGARLDTVALVAPSGQLMEVPDEYHITLMFILKCYGYFFYQCGLTVEQSFVLRRVDSDEAKSDEDVPGFVGFGVVDLEAFFSKYLVGAPDMPFFRRLAEELRAM